MREIKFRAWCAEDQVMIYDLNSPQLIHGHLIDELYKFQQYTGLKDKNCKEIYEGDILHDSFINSLFKVIYNVDRFTLIDNKEEFYDNGDYYHGDDIKWEDLEIIGNIYENPELFKLTERDDLC